MKALFKLGLIVGMNVLTSLYYGWVLMTLWGWFFVTGAGFAALPYVFWVGVPFIWGQVRLSDLETPKSGESDETGVAVLMLWSIIKIIGSLVGLALAGLVFLLLV